MGQLGMGEIALIFLVALLVFGPKKLPELGKSLGKGLREFKRATNDLKSSWESQVKDIDREVSSAARDIKNVGKDIEKDLDNSIRQERPDSPSGAANGRASTDPTTPSASTTADDAVPPETPDAATEDKSPTDPTTPSASTTADDAVPPETPDAATEDKSPEQPA